MEAILVFIFGTLIGSFLNVVILRLPMEQPLTGRSHCFSCRHNLAALDLVPVFSFLFLKGRCRYCKAKISWRYAFILLLTGLLFVFAWSFFKPDSLVLFLQLINAWLVISVLLAVFVIDLEHFLILDKVVLVGCIGAGLLNLVLDLLTKPALGFESRFISGLFAALVLTLLFFFTWYISRGRALGFGDVKFAIFLGLVLGWPKVLAGFMLAILLGGVVSAFLLALASKTLKSRVPFGTFLTVGALIAFFYGDRLIAWYLALLGI